MNHRAVPSPFAAEDQWDRWRYQRRLAAPGWAHDRDYVTSLALDHLPRVCAEIGAGLAVAMLPRPNWWGGSLPEAVRLRHGLTSDGLRQVVALRAAPGVYDLLLIDRATGEWQQPNASRRGDDLVSLAAWRWGATEAKAAWRLARLCGAGRPMP